MWLLLICCLGTLLVAYVVYTLLATSGSQLGDNSFEAFIISPDGRPDTVFEDSADYYLTDYTVPGCQILILYGTEYGLAEEVARKLFDRLCVFSVHLWQPRLVNMKDFTVVDFDQETAVLMVMSTAGDGVPPSDARPFVDYINNSDLDLGHLTFSLLALGDSNYPHYCRAGRNLHKRLLEKRGRELCPRADCDQESWSVINDWMDTVMTSLQKVKFVERMDYLQISRSHDEGVTRNSPFMAFLKVKKNLTEMKLETDKETIHCEFDISGSNMTWVSGDALGIYPVNNTAEVLAVLKAANFSGNEKVAAPKWTYNPKPNDLSLKDVLQTYCDLKHVSMELFDYLCEVADDCSEKLKLQQFLEEATSRTNTKLRDYLDGREVVDVLEDFHSSCLSVEKFLSSMKPLLPRYYSIASSPAIDINNVCVTVAVVRYSTHGKDRTGVATTFLKDRLDVSQTCPVFISRNPDFRLPSCSDYPIIMIGPGTGIAPFRCFIQERVQTQSRGENRLYFGCQHVDQDYLYKDELEKWSNDGHLKLRTAFSRDQPRKIYVQDLILEDSHILWQLISECSAHVYVCGDAKHMARDVHEALINVVVAGGSLNATEATQYLLNMEDSQRYQKDVWIA